MTLKTLVWRGRDWTALAAVGGAILAITILPGIALGIGWVVKEKTPISACYEHGYFENYTRTPRACTVEDYFTTGVVVLLALAVVVWVMMLLWPMKVKRDAND